MKKSRFLVAAVAAFTLASCSIEDLMFWKKGNDKLPEGNWEFTVPIKGGSEEEKIAILDTINNKPIATQNGKASNELYPESYYEESLPTLNEDDGDGIKLTTKQVQGENTVELTWTIDETQTYFDGRLKSDDYHDIVDIKYQGFGAPDGEFTWTLSKIVCGKAVSENANLVYKVKIKNEEYKHDNAKLSEIYSIKDEQLIVKDDKDNVINKWESTYDIIDYAFHAEAAKYSPYFITNNPQATEKQYLYYNVPGKVIYTAPDGNWGLLADGKNVLEFYAGSGTALNEKNWPNLANKYVKISGNMGQYCGNVQLGFVTKILSLKDSEKSTIAEPDLSYRALDEAFLASLKVEGYTCEQQAVKLADGSCLANSLAQVTGTYIEGSLKKGTDEATIADLASGQRATFELQVGAQKMTVAYDYHTDRNGDNGTFNALKAALTKGGQMTVKGTMRYSGNNSGPFISEGNNGVWNIVPFAPEHFA